MDSRSPQGETTAGALGAFHHGASESSTSNGWQTHDIGVARRGDQRRPRVARFVHLDVVRSVGSMSQMCATPVDA